MPWFLNLEKRNNSIVLHKKISELNDKRSIDTWLLFTSSILPIKLHVEKRTFLSYCDAEARPSKNVWKFTLHHSMWYDLNQAFSPVATSIMKNNVYSLKWVVCATKKFDRSRLIKEQ